MFSGGKTSKAPALFDIRIKSADHDVIVVKGSPEEASSALLSGTIVLSVLEPMQIKKLSLRLYGMLRLNLTTSYQGPKGPAQRTVKYNKRFFEHVWNNIDIQDYFQNLYDNYGSQKSILSRNNSSSSLSGLQKKAKSTSSLISLTGSSGSNSHILVQGNYEFPFSAILPGSVTESVEGLPNASVIYKLQATIERSKFATDLICKRHLRIVRTLTPDAVELSETMSVDNTWPKKVDYSISVPGKAIVIGSATPIHILIVPLLKGLKLGPIKISLVEYSSYCAPYGTPNSQERIVAKIKLKDPLQHLSDSDESANGDGADLFSCQDKWEVDTMLQVPPSLSKCTQDCNILTNLKVRHKLKFVISLVNPDGHVSELRASLPVQLFISPFVALGVRATDSLDSSASVSEHNTDNEADNETIFANSFSEINLTGLNVESGAATPNPTSKLMAPPNYGSHIYDRLWSEISVENTPVHSGRQSPVGLNSGSLLNSQQNMHALEQGLQRLHLEREQENTSVNNHASDATSNLQTQLRVQDGTPSSATNIPTNDYFSVPLPQHAQSMVNIPFSIRSPAPMMSPGVDHISRTDSFGPNMPLGSPSKSGWELNTLSRVPSYGNAMKSDPIPDDLPPAYPDNEEAEHGYEPERPKLLHHKSSNIQRTTSGTQLSHAALSRSNNSSTTSLSSTPLSRNNTGGSDMSVPGYSQHPANSRSSPNINIKSNTVNKHFGFGMTPLGSNNDHSSSPSKPEQQQHGTLPFQRAPLKGSMPNLSRTGSLASLVGLLQKKEKK